MNNQRSLSKLISLLLMISALLFSAKSTQAQFIVGAPPWNTTSIRTEGGVTYFVQSAAMLACNYIHTTPVTISGTNLSLTVAQMQWLGPCAACLDCYHNETNTVVLGKLQPGDYCLNVKTYGAFDSTPSLSYKFNFTVSSLNNVMFFTGLKSDKLELQVQGVPAATYTVQGSTTLTNWTTVYTTQGAPFTFATNTQSGGLQFFRVLVGPGSVSGK